MQCRRCDSNFKVRLPKSAKTSLHFAACQLYVTLHCMFSSAFATTVICSYRYSLITMHGEQVVPWCLATVYQKHIKPLLPGLLELVQSTVVRKEILHF